MKKLSLFFIALLAITMTLTTSCSTSIKQIGSVNMLSHRNVNPNLEYQPIATYSGGSPKEKKSTRAVTIEEAVDQTVKKVAGGEFLMNAKIYIVKTPRYHKDLAGNKTNLFYFCEGDVWGNPANVSYRGFKVGDKVIVDGALNTIATIKSLKDDKTCFIERVNGVIEEVRYDKISKAQ